MVSARFLINGLTPELGVNVSANSLVTLTVVDITGFRSAEWEIFGTDDLNQITPIVTKSGSPNGSTATFTTRMGAGSYGIRCTLNGGKDDTGRTNAGLKFGAGIYVLNGAGLRLGFVNETMERGINGWLDLINGIANAVGGGPAGVPLTTILGYGNVTSGKNIVLTEGDSITGSAGNIKLDGYVNLNSHKLTGLLNPTGASDGANKSYVDAAISTVSVVGNTAPVNVNKSAAAVGVLATAARSDHKHSIDTASPVSVGTANAEGTATTLARSDHTHIVSGLAIASQTKGDTLYFDGTSWVRLAAAQDGYLLTTHTSSSAPSWTAGSPLTSTAPNDVDKSTALTGVSGFAARSDHKHSILTNTAGSIGATNAEGSASTLARSDHAHSVVDLSIAGQVQGNVLFFNGTNWVRLANSTDGYYLTTHSTGANPTWTKATIAGGDLNIAGQAQGDVLYFNGSNWVRLAASSDGYALITHGAGNNPTWDNNFKTQSLNTTGALNVGAPITINSLTANPSILQAPNSISVSAVGQTLSLTSQSLSGFNTIGGNLTLGSGTGTSLQGASDGYVTINRGAQTVASWLTGNSVGSNTDDFIAFGKIPATQGNIRLPTSSSIFARNLANNGNIGIIQWALGNMTIGGAYPIVFGGSALTVQSTSGIVLSDAVNTIATVNSTSGAQVVFGLAMTNPTISQVTNSTLSATATTLTVRAQAANGVNSFGGNLQLSSGTGTSAQGAPDGYVFINRGAQQVARWQTGLVSPATNSQIDDFIALGRTVASVGNIRLGVGTSIAGRNVANSADAVLLSWAADSVGMGSSTFATVVAGSTTTVASTANIIFQPANATAMIFTGGPRHVTFNAFVANPTFTQEPNPNTSIVGTTYSFLAQNAVGVNARGGNVVLGSGTGTSAQGAPDGYVIINRGTQVVASWLTGLSAGTPIQIDDFVAFGRTPATIGNIRFTGSTLSGLNPQSGIFGRNIANTTNNLLLGWGSDQLVIGGSFATTMIATTLGVNLTSSASFNIGGTAAVIINSNGVSIGGAAQTAALVGQGSIAQSVTAQPMNITSSPGLGFNSRGGNLTLGSGTGTSLQGAADGYVFMMRGNSIVNQWQTGISSLTALNDDFITFGKNTATVGNVRLDGYAAIIARNGANSVNRNLMLWGSDTLNVGNPGSAINVIGNAITIGDGTADIIYNANNVSSTNHQFKLAGNTVLNISLTSISTTRNLLLFTGTSTKIQLGDSLAPSGTYNSLTLAAQGGGGSSGTYTGGTIVVSGGNVNAGLGTGTGGDVCIAPGLGNSTTLNGNIVLGAASAPSWQSMSNGIYIAPSTTIPTGNPPSNGFFVYPDPADGKLKARGSAGTVTIIALP